MPILKGGELSKSMGTWGVQGTQGRFTPVSVMRREVAGRIFTGTTTGSPGATSNAHGHCHLIPPGWHGGTLKEKLEETPH